MMGVVQSLYLNRVAKAFGLWFEVIREHNMVTESVRSLATVFPVSSPSSWVSEKTRCTCLADPSLSRR